jgi:HTH-type transcriptional regulator / antitoxin HipB
MIQNERQYKITQTKLRDLEKDLDRLNSPDPDLHPRKILARQNSLKILIGELQQEVMEYEQLKSGQITQFPLHSIQDLPMVMIKARIAAGMTQKELAEKIGVQEQQIQRYEFNQYHAVGFDRLQEVLSALRIGFSQAVMQINLGNTDFIANQQPIFKRILELLPELSIEQLTQKVDELRSQQEHAATHFSIWLEDIAQGKSLQLASAGDTRQSNPSSNDADNMIKELRRLAHRLFYSGERP